MIANVDGMLNGPRAQTPARDHVPALISAGAAIAITVIVIVGVYLIVRLVMKGTS